MSTDRKVPFFQGKRQIIALLAVNLVMAVAVVFAISTNFTESFASPPPKASPHHRAKVAEVDPEAKGVNEGKKKHAAKIKMHAAPQVDPSTIAGPYGQYGGCVPGYGQGKACLPPISPAAVAMGMTAEEHPWDCGEVIKLFTKGIKVNKKADDQLRLDFNKDGIACGAGD